MYDFEAIGKQLAEKHGLAVVEKEFETDYFLISDTSFVWSEVLRTFPHDHYIVFFNTPEKVKIDFIKLLDDILIDARKNLNNLLFEMKKSEIIGAGKGWKI